MLTSTLALTTGIRGSEYGTKTIHFSLRSSKFNPPGLMGVAMRSTRTSVAGKRFAKANDVLTGRVFSRRRPQVGLDALFLIVLLLSIYFLAGNVRTYLSVGSAVTKPAAGGIQIDFDKGFVPDVARKSDPEDVEKVVAAEDADVEHYMESGARFSDASLEKGSKGITYEQRAASGSKAALPIPLPPADAPVLLPKKVGNVQVTKDTLETARREVLKNRKRNRRKKYLRWKERQTHKQMQLSTDAKATDDVLAPVGSDSTIDTHDVDERSAKDRLPDNVIQTQDMGELRLNELHTYSDNLSTSANPTGETVVSEGLDVISPAAGSEAESGRQQHEPRRIDDHLSVEPIVHSPPTHSNRNSEASSSSGTQQEDLMKPLDSQHLQGQQEGYRWDVPHQPILEEDHHITVNDLQEKFNVLLANKTLVHKSLLPLLESYDIRNDPEFRDMAMHSSLEYLHMRYVPVGRRGWGGVLGGAPSSVPSDHLYHIRHTGDQRKGYGMYASTNIPVKTILGVYGGELVRAADAEDGRYAWMAPQMVLRDKASGVLRNEPFVLDGFNVGNFLRFVNDLGRGTHNVDPIWIPVDNRWTLFYETTRPIHAGEEMSISYGDDYWNRQAEVSNHAVDEHGSYQPRSDEDLTAVSNAEREQPENISSADHSEHVSLDNQAAPQPGSEFTYQQQPQALLADVSGHSATDETVLRDQHAMAHPYSESDLTLTDPVFDPQDTVTVLRAARETTYVPQGAERAPAAGATLSELGSIVDLRQGLADEGGGAASTGVDASERTDINDDESDGGTTAESRAIPPLSSGEREAAVPAKEYSEEGFESGSNIANLQHSASHEHLTDEPNGQTDMAAPHQPTLDNLQPGHGIHNPYQGMAQVSGAGSSTAIGQSLNDVDLSVREGRSDVQTRSSPDSSQFYDDASARSAVRRDISGAILSSTRNLGGEEEIVEMAREAVSASG